MFFQLCFRISLKEKNISKKKGPKDLVGGSGFHPQEIFIFLSLWSLIFVFFDTIFDIFYLRFSYGNMKTPFLPKLFFIANFEPYYTYYHPEFKH